ncbi:MAG: 2-oxo acid dehydrogenase subunit E2 [Leptolinea sp.]|jgi:pyruvate/2-oxoglutarate dehydrogenase complex dihydrolipoamide acyltransferase (E2) component|nr:2-oxo acid dehydrogenase subunit E2 [Leptolinea sp.]
MTDQVQKLTSLQKSMARQMTKSLEAPQFQLATDVDCTRLLEFKKRSPFKPSVTTILAKLVADELVKFPLLNSSWNEDAIILHEEVNLGIAVDTKRGLLVPVIRDASQKDLQEIHRGMELIKEKRESGKFSMDDLADATFTISNLGAFNISFFSAIVNMPQVGILAVSKMTEMPVVRFGQITTASVMRLCLSMDHRVVDGAYGSRFMSELAASIENL